MLIRKSKPSDQDVRVQVRGHYGKIAAEFSGSDAASCCEPSGSGTVNVVSQLYQTTDVEGLPPEVTGLSLGCGDPVTLASLKVGQTVLDLGSGGGIDCFLAAKRVGDSGRVIGVDMTAEMKERPPDGGLSTSAIKLGREMGPSYERMADPLQRVVSWQSTFNPRLPGEWCRQRIGV